MVCDLSICATFLQSCAGSKNSEVQKVRYMFVNCIVPYKVAVSNIGYKFTRSAYVIEGLGYNSRLMIQVLALWESGCHFLIIGSDFKFYFYFQSAVLFVWKMCYICLCDNFREQIEFFVYCRIFVILIRHTSLRVNVCVMENWDLALLRALVML